MNVRLHIERLVVDETLGLDPRTLEAAVIDGLSRALSDRPDLPFFKSGGRIEALGEATVRFSGPSSTWGEQLGQSVHAALAASLTGRAR